MARPRLLLALLALAASLVLAAPLALAALVALSAPLALAAPAAAQMPGPPASPSPDTPPAIALSLRVGPEGGVDYGQRTLVSGRLVRDAAPAAGEAIVLEARRFPYRRPFAPVRVVTTDADGRFAIRQRFDRNHQVRAQSSSVTSAVATAFVFPRSRLTFQILQADLVRLTQTYRTPSDVRLTQPTRFYVGRRGARTAPVRARARTRRTGRGRFVARATVGVPAAYRGRFRYASCFRYSARSGMGDPAARCPVRTFRFDR